MKYIAGLLLILMIVAGFSTMSMINRPNNLTENVGIVLNKGESVRSLADNLEKSGIINSSLLFRAVLRVLKVDKKLRAGEYMFAPRQNMLQVAEKLRRGDVFYRKITIPEGLSSAQVKILIENEANLSGEITAKMPEGSLLPETYTFSKGDSRDGIVRQAQKALEKVLDEVWADNQNKQVADKKELLILASIIEKETGVPEERNDVSAVFTNRLQKGMMLQTDPTVIYALTKGEQDFGRALLKKDLDYDSPYNTYRNYGLPPTPICNAGREAISAAAHPNNVNYLYFVASGKGGHLFASTLSAHNENVVLYRQALRKNK